MQRSIGDQDQALKDEEFDIARLGIDQDTVKNNNNQHDGAGNNKHLQNDKKLADNSNTPKDIPHFDDRVYDQARLDHKMRKDQPRVDDVDATPDHRLSKENGEKDHSGGGGSTDDQMLHRQLAEDQEEDTNDGLFGEEDEEEVGANDYTYHHNEDNLGPLLQDKDITNENEHPSDAFAAGVLKERKGWNPTAIHRSRNSARGGGENLNRIHVKDAGALAATRAKELPAHIPVFTVVAMTIAMAGAAGLGALPFFFVKNLSKHWSAIATAVACGVMFAASFDLIHEGQPYGPQLVILGIFLGGIFIRFMQKWLDGMEEVSFGHLHGTKARRLVLMVGIMAAHAIGEGCGVGVSFCGDRGWAQGVLTTLAIGVHNVPEGLAKATVLVSQGASAYEALFWSIVTCLPQPLVAVPSFMFVEAFTMLLPTALGFAAGCMIWMVFAELLPEALEGAKSSEIASAATLSAAALEGIRMSFEALEGPAGAFLSPFDDGDWAELIPAIAEVSPAVFAAALAAGLISGSSLPTPVVACFSAVALAVCGIAPLASQIVSSHVPLLHTGSAALAGMAAILLLRRYVLQSLIGGSGGGGGSSHNNNTSMLNGGMKYSNSGVDNFLYEVNNSGYSNGGHYGAAAGLGVGGIVGGIGGGIGNVTQRARGDYLPSQPDSPSKMRGGLLPLGNNTSREHGGAAGKAPRRLAAPAMAAGATVIAALAMQGVALGWHFTRELAGVDIGALTLVPAMAATLAVHGAAAAGAIRAVVGRSVGAGGIIGLLIGGISACAMLISYFSALTKPYEMVLRLTYPIGWTETLNAAACGALCMAALLQVAVAMSIHPKHGRFGILMGVLCFGAIGGLLTVGKVAGNAQASAVMETFLM